MLQILSLVAEPARGCSQWGCSRDTGQASCRSASSRKLHVRPSVVPGAAASIRFFVYGQWIAGPEQSLGVCGSLSRFFPAVSDASDNGKQGFLSFATLILELLGSSGALRQGELWTCGVAFVAATEHWVYRSIAAWSSRRIIFAFVSLCKCNACHPTT